ncbi:hypothetical protein BDN70DRAFT_881672 [Pholiota conissans]|uniref:Uncharacterized protein n=1 Tax=Pholiota conissans TaxID=109636 RepID=A0A9P5YWG3_9AGAR|nr:hypothetical protein BDN70DRAFT_881672 [Pholiota conissans]
MAPFPITEAELTGSFSESVLWGFHIITLGFCMRALLRYKNQWKRSRDVNWPMVATSLALFAVATFDVLTGFYHTLLAFVFFQGEGGAAAEYTNISGWINIARTVTVVVQTIIGDAVLIYRCWVVYQRSFVVIAVSFLLWLALTASGVWIIFLEATLKSRVLISAKQLTPAITLFWAVTITLNIITTGLLVYRIWKVDSSGRKYLMSNGTGKSGSGRLRSVMRIIIESGLMYSAIALITFVCVIVGNNAVYVTSDMEVQIVGIAFNLILVRTANFYSKSDGTTIDPSRGTAQSLPLQIVSPIRGSKTANTKTEIYVSSSVTKQGAESIKGMDEESDGNYMVNLRQ